MDIMGECRTYFTPPLWEKRTFVYTVSNTLQDDLNCIRLDGLETDPALTLKILRMANSPLYAVRSNVTSLQQAVLALGLNRVANIVLSVSIFSKCMYCIMLSRSNSAEHMKNFRYHSSCTGMVAKNSVTKIKRNCKDLEFIGGLLHDIGKMAMIQFDPENYAKIIELVRSEGILDVEAEMLN